MATRLESSHRLRKTLHQGAQASDKTDMNRLDTFIANIYRSVQFRGTENFREATLRSLGVLVPFDGALWGTGNYNSREFHSSILMGMHPDYPKALEKTVDINPIYPRLMHNVGQAVDMAQACPDAQFYASDIYRRCFSRFGVERILSCVDVDPRTNIYTLISLYRFDRDEVFTSEERALFERAAYHMMHASMHAFFLHVAAESGADAETGAAICDSHGMFYQAMPEFIDLLEQHLPHWQGDQLPFDLPPPGERVVINGLCVESQPYADLYCLRVWEQRPTDTLSQRDRDIVNRVCKGMTFKEIAREMDLAPSTISNRLYRIYRKLGVTSRAGLARLVHGRDDDADEAEA